MGKPTALGLARLAIANALVGDVRRGPNGALVIQSAMESPAPLRPGRYLLLDTEEAALLTKRIITGEHALMLAAAKRTVLKRRR